jgi:cobalt-zinc-cadmium efflux system protein
MSHYRRQIAAAAALNTGIFVIEAAAGYGAGSLSLMMDGVHNFSDELALVCLYLAFIWSKGPSRALLRSANLCNSAGLIAVSALLLWQAIQRFQHPVPVHGLIPIAVGLAAAAANYGVARLLLKPSENNAAVRLAYIHNIGDVWVSLAPVSAGLLLLLTGYAFFDPLIAGAVAVWIIVTTVQEVLASHEELMWPGEIVCGHADEDDAAAVAR